MSRVRRAAVVWSAAVVLGGAKAEDAASFLLVVGAIVAVLVVLGLPFGLLLHSVRRDWIDREARALERRATACALLGAGVVIAWILVLALLQRAPAIGLGATACAVAWFFAGFAGCARAHGERLVRSVGEGRSALVLGWLARAGLFAVPVLWPLLGAYVVVTAFGAPLAALFARAPSPPAEDATPG